MLGDFNDVGLNSETKGSCLYQATSPSQNRNKPTKIAQKQIQSLITQQANTHHHQCEVALSTFPHRLSTSLPDTLFTRVVDIFHNLPS